MSLNIEMDVFCSWLCQHERDVVGHPGTWFHSPLACWLSEMTGHTYGVEGRLYGRALYDTRYWLLLPRWAAVFTSWVEVFASRPITGAEALEVLARVELAS